ncbi:unnamed protein product [Amoebophrya sp. A25]|nr:unnamed protein product [Amoebophrya sp. A25]|eukprot:GSA25T00015841001.1
MPMKIRHQASKPRIVGAPFGPAQRLFMWMVYLMVWHSSLYWIILVEASGDCQGSMFYCHVTDAYETDCTVCGDYNVADLGTNKCIKRQMFSSDYTVNDFFGLLIWFLSSGLAMASGAGGGGIYVPLGMLLLRFGAKTATGLSQASIFGSSLGGLFINLRQRHPIANRPVIDLDMALFLAPMEMAGAVLGVLIQQPLPDWSVILIMAVVLSYTSYLTLNKGFTQREKEKKAITLNKASLQEKDQVVDAVVLGDHIEQGNLNDTGTRDIEQGNGICSASLDGKEATQDGIEHAANKSSFRKEPDGDDVDTSAARPTDLGQVQVELSDATEGQHNFLSISKDEKPIIPATSFKPDSSETTTPSSTQRSLNGTTEPWVISAQAVDKNQENIGATKLELQETTAEVPKDAAAIIMGALEEGLPSYLRRRANQQMYTPDEWIHMDAKVPQRQWGYLIGLCLFLMLMLLLRGGKGVESMLKDAVPVCGAGYWILTCLSFLGLFLFGLVMARRAVHKSIRKQAVGYKFVDGDVLWTWRGAGFYAFWTFIAGIIAGLIGIGGGMVLGPLMLQMGLLPQVSTATTATLIVLTSASAAFMFITSGLVPLSYAATFFVVSFLGAYLGKAKIDRYVKERNATSILIFILAFIIASATIMISVAGVSRYSGQDWCLESAQPLCKG